MPITDNDIITSHVTPFYATECPSIDLSVWEKWMSMPKDQAIAMLKRDMPSDMAVTLNVKEDGRGNISIRANGFKEDRDFSIAKKIIEPGWIEFDKKKTGTGIGRKLIRNEIEFFSTCGLKRFEIYAGLEAGGYSWARFGFLPDLSEAVKRNDFEKFREGVDKRYTILASCLNSEEKEQLQPFVRFKGEHDLWHVADAGFDVKPSLRKAFNGASGTRLRELRRLICDTTVLEGEAPLPAGRCLLAGSNWYGKMDFNDKAQMERFEKYVGGFNQPLGMRPGRKMH